MNPQRIRRTESDEPPAKTGPTQLDIIHQLKAQVEYWKQAVIWMTHVNAGNLLLLDMTLTSPFKVPFERGRMLTIASVSLCILEGPQPSHGKDPSFFGMFPDVYFPSEDMVKDRAYHELHRRKNLVEEMQKVGPVESLTKWPTISDLFHNDILQSNKPESEPTSSTRVDTEVPSPLIQQQVI